MSAGPFKISKYELDNDTIRPIRIQVETTTDDNPEPDGGSAGPFVKISGSRRAFGVHPRKLVLSREVGDGDYGVAKVYARQVILTKQAFEDAVIGSTIVYAALDWVIASKQSETTK